MQVNECSMYFGDYFRRANVHSAPNMLNPSFNGLLKQGWLQKDLRGKTCTDILGNNFTHFEKILRGAKSNIYEGIPEILKIFKGKQYIL